MKPLVTTVLIAIGLLASGCARYAEIYQVKFSSKAGDTLATGTIKLPSPLPKEGKIRGKYHLQMTQTLRTDKTIDWFYRLFEGKVDGEVEWDVHTARSEGPSHILEFMPGLADANIAGATPKLNDGKAKGKWSYAIYAGGYSGGGFEIERK